MSRVWARFDDLRSGRAIAFRRPRRILAARAPEAVPRVLEQAERATAGGEWAVGYLAYEAAPGLDPRLVARPPSADDPPVAWFALCADPVRVAPVGARPAAGPVSATWRPDRVPAEYRADVERVRQRIATGEVYQCNLTAAVAGRVDGDLRAFYRDLACAQGGAHNAYLDIGTHVVVSASPELFFERRGPDVLFTPMKGTARRGRDAREDRARAAALRADPKERAENVMIVDLIRNDVARVGEIGSVRVSELLRVERYGTVLQMTSDVRARLRPDVSLVELFAAVFPSGSVTGAPKIAAMRLVRELERRPRGVYCGCIGHIAPGEPARARFAVAIRTAVVDRRTRVARYGTGAGITWASDAVAEQEEIVCKTAVLATADRGMLREPGRDGVVRAHPASLEPESSLARVCPAADRGGSSQLTSQALTFRRRQLD